MAELSFEQKVERLAQDAVLKILSSGDWLKIGYENRMEIPKADLHKVYSLVRTERVLALAAEQLEQRLADSIINNMATEVGTDMKKIMCNPDLREDLRSILRERIKGAAANVLK
jgi:hypothetical protein